jgi:hypothetical protein
VAQTHPDFELRAEILTALEEIKAAVSADGVSGPARFRA